MNRLNGVFRTLSLIWTPFNKNTFSNDMPPEIVRLPLGPVPCTAGDRSTAASSVRVVGRIASVSALRLVARLNRVDERIDTPGDVDAFAHRRRLHGHVDRD